MSRVSIRMLRHYDEIGLLRPVKIDKYTGYRYYSEEQLPVMARISLLRDVGFGLAAIKEILKCYDNKEELERYLQLRYAELMEASEETARRLRILDTALKRLRKDEEMKYDVILKTLPERHVASVRQNIPRYDEEGMLWHILFKETEPIGVAIAEPPLFGAVLHDQEYKEADVDVEVQVTVKGDYPDTEHVRFKTEPEVTVASITFKGSYAQFTDVYAALAAWVQANGYEFCGPMRDFYYVSPHETRNPEEFVTEVCCQVREKTK